jgi:predicted DNA-binding transcriptional regulator YafY
VNRTDRLYTLVEELRAAAPRPRTSRWLAERFEVSVRTIERDLSALQQAGVPIWAAPGPGGGYSIDPSMTLPPLNFTSSEALAVSLALARAGTMPYAAAARTALRKVVAAMSGAEADEARALADRVRLIATDDPEPLGISPLLERALLDREVIEIDYVAKDGARTVRQVEPVGFVGGDRAWYLSAWCRLRDGGRVFRVDRILAVRPTGEIAPERPFEIAEDSTAPEMRRLTLTE